MNDPIRDCPHGHMKGKCDTCELIEAEKTVTDNTEVIRTLEARIAELEAVAEAAEIDIRRKNGKGWVSAEEAGVWKALRAAGYLGGGE